MDFLHRLFSADGFMPHGCCYIWNPSLIGLHVISDAIIAFAYYSIPITLIYFIRKRQDLVFDWMFACFAAFIVLCGTTHVMEILNIWHPTYWLAGTIKALTALVSIVTAILLVRLIPQALALPSPEQLRKSNQDLQREIQERQSALSRIEALNAQLVAQTAKVEAVNKELETFCYSISHDLRAPLRHIDGYVDLLQAPEPISSDDRDRFMGRIAESSKQMGLLIENLMAFSLMGRAAMHPQMISANALVAEAREELDTETHGRDITWNVSELPEIFVDRTLFKQVWMNLIGNALKYTRKKPRVEISIGCHETATEQEFFVKDNGAGFDMQYAHRLFGIFERLHTRKDFEGTGIGLANAQRIISRHGGRIWAEAAPEQGATFYFTLPKTTF